MNTSQTVLKDMARQFLEHKRRAEGREIPWELTLDQYIEIWRPFWRRKKGLTLIRNNYAGAFKIGNVHIVTIKMQKILEHKLKRKSGGFMYDPATRKRCDESHTICVDR